MEKYAPDFTENFSTAKSPQQMLSSLAKSYWAEKNGVDPKDIFMVSVMPCTSKKYEISRDEYMAASGVQDTDVGPTTREPDRDIRLDIGTDEAALDAVEMPSVGRPFWSWREHAVAACGGVAGGNGGRTWTNPLHGQGADVDGGGAVRGKGGEVLPAGLAEGVRGERGWWKGAARGAPGQTRTEGRDGGPAVCGGFCVLKGDEVRWKA
jgi:hypothetical protein